MNNPFFVRWLKGWSFQTVFMDGNVEVEAHGFGICLRTSLLPGESPKDAADRLVISEDQRRKSLHNAWVRGQLSPKNSFLSILKEPERTKNKPPSLVIVP